jgi:hypothetical protein
MWILTKDIASVLYVKWWRPVPAKRRYDMSIKWANFLGSLSLNNCQYIALLDHQKTVCLNYMATKAKLRKRLNYFFVAILTENYSNARTRTCLNGNYW